MFQRKYPAIILLITLLVPGFGLAQQPAAAEDAIAKIKDEGMKRSQAMAVMRYLTDVIGARLTNSPAQRRANRWTKEQFEKWGLKNAMVDPWGEFGRGWEIKRFSASVTTPEEFIAFRTYPKAWSPGTNGAITGDVVIVDAASEADLEKYKGKLKGAIVLVSPPRGVRPGFEPVASRLGEKGLADMENAKLPAATGQGAPFKLATQISTAQDFNAIKLRFYLQEGVAVLVEPSLGTDSGTIRVMGAGFVPPVTHDPNLRVYSKEAPPAIPQLAAETEQYNRLFRLVKEGTPIKMTVDLDVKFYADDLQAYNTIAEIPGTDLKDEVVMIGAHLDSWHSGTGATDNAAGVTVVMEAMRILQASGLKPRRTIRVGLWSAEEQGLLGSRGYVNKYLAVIGDGSPHSSSRELMNGGYKINITKKPAYDKFAAYYNLDNGTGRIRGIYMQGNEALRPIFREWLAPFKEMGASTLTVSGTGGTDHLPFDIIGLSGFQFIQDPIEYFGRTWHTTQDVFDRTIEDDLKQSAIIMAAFAYNSAMTNEKLPRKANPFVTVAGLQNLDMRNVMEEAAFRRAGFNRSICGQELSNDELPAGFSNFLTVGTTKPTGEE